MKKAYLFFTVLVAALFIFACENRTPPQQAETMDQTEKEKYIATGQQIVAATFAALGGSLQKAIKNGGVPEAVKYCSLAASPLVDSLSEVHNASIRRTSMKVRNPDNQPTKLEQSMLEQYERKWNAGEDLSPLVQEIDGQQIAFYAPIQVNEFCLQCHGKLGETLTPENHAIIKASYPVDKAIGYADGDLRGMWSVQFRIE